MIKDWGGLSPPQPRRKFRQCTQQWRVCVVLKDVSDSDIFKADRGRCINLLVK